MKRGVLQGRYGFSITTDLPFEAAVARTKEALAAEGFGVLTEINVQETLQKKLGVDFRRYLILGACNPTLAHQALTHELDIGLILPCNVIVHEEGSGSRVAAFDPVAALGLARNVALEPFGREASAHLHRALEAIAPIRGNVQVPSA